MCKISKRKSRTCKISKVQNLETVCCIQYCFSTMLRSNLLAFFSFFNNFLHVIFIVCLFFSSVYRAVHVYMLRTSFYRHTTRVIKVHPTTFATMTSIEFITSNKGKPLLVLDSYVYELNKSTTKVKYWKCEVKFCSATVYTDAHDQFLKKSGQHDTHLPSPESIEV